MTFLRRHSKTLVFALAWIVLPALLSACPLCKEAQPSNAVAGTDMWRGMYWSILLMVTMPFAAAGTIAILVLRARRRQTSMSGGSAGARS